MVNWSLYRDCIISQTFPLTNSAFFASLPLELISRAFPAWKFPSQSLLSGEPPSPRGKWGWWSSENTDWRWAFETGWPASCLAMTPNGLVDTSIETSSHLFSLCWVCFIYFQRSWIQEFSPIKLLHFNLQLKIFFPATVHQMSLVDCSRWSRDSPWHKVPL